MDIWVQLGATKKVNEVYFGGSLGLQGWRLLTSTREGRGGGETNKKSLSHKLNKTKQTLRSCRYTVPFTV